MSSIENEYSSLVRECAEQGRLLMQLLSNKGTPEPLYLYARESKPGKPGQLPLAVSGASTTKKANCSPRHQLRLWPTLASQIIAIRYAAEAIAALAIFASIHRMQAFASGPWTREK